MAFEIEGVRYLPEIIPQAGIVDIGENSSKSILNLKRIYKERNPYFVVLKSFTAESNSNVEFRFTVDGRLEAYINCGMLDLKDIDAYYLATDNLAIDLRNTGSALSNFRYRYSLAIVPANVAYKIRYGKSLVGDEPTIADEYDVEKAIKLGVAPYPLDYYIKRVYNIYRRSVNVYSGSLPTSGIEIKLNPTARTFIVLTGIKTTIPSDPSYNTIITITRDDSPDDYVTLTAYAMSDSGGNPVRVDCFIPAIDTITVSVSTDTAITDYKLELYYDIVFLTDYLKMAFGLMAKEEDEALWRMVKSGIITV